MLLVEKRIGDPNVFSLLVVSASLELTHRCLGLSRRFGRDCMTIVREKKKIRHV
jgi:hypothetical protein